MLLALQSNNPAEIKAAWKESYNLASQVLRQSEAKKAEDVQRGSKPEKGQKSDVHSARNVAKKAFRGYVLSGVSIDPKDQKRVNEDLNTFAKSITRTKLNWNEAKKNPEISKIWKEYQTAKANGEDPVKPSIPEKVDLNNTRAEYKKYVTTTLKV